MDDQLRDIRDRLEALAEALAELAMDRLRASIDAAGTDGPDPASRGLLAEERRLSRARRAVERAAAILGDPSGDAEA